MDGKSEKKGGSSQDQIWSPPEPAPRADIGTCMAAQVDHRHCSRLPAGDTRAYRGHSLEAISSQA
jgi:hypothetical protein